jgi:hypothetical protein
MTLLQKALFTAKTRRAPRANGLVKAPRAFGSFAKLGLLSFVEYQQRAAIFSLFEFLQVLKL